MRGVVLAAGRGSRLGELTARRPKCLVPLAGRPLLDWQRAALTAGGVTELAVVAGYRADLVAAQGLPVFPAPRWERTNMVGSLLAAAPWLRSGPCVVSYGDIVYSAATVRNLLAADGDLAISYDPDWLRLWRLRFADPLDDAETFRRRPDGTLSEIGGTPHSVDEVTGQYLGLLRFTPPAWAAVERLLAGLPPRQVDALDLTSLLQALVDAGERIGTVPCPDAWAEVDDADDLAVATDLVRRGRLAFAGGQEARR
ncbi:phosphocholine cytidylyltransferase family protein [Micromonospora cathayae]|uniref:Phosphocholine cytidylyltransferase family protein n=1 Tax=Micromonospora cathayae TaxID=3028804 RepID=A0ABY7ZP72_9ACTN|nr:phosphocholine cytidylyltransferase family protein [Micromonospora sp. HUAS 3]WDZ84799.1 phosphocholine cytidylyltransferase family protein [Micromonospora sp. HUAS 3]